MIVSRSSNKPRSTPSSPSSLVSLRRTKSSRQRKRSIRRLRALPGKSQSSRCSPSTPRRRLRGSRPRCVSLFSSLLSPFETSRLYFTDSSLISLVYSAQRGCQSLADVWNLTRPRLPLVRAIRSPPPSLALDASSPGSVQSVTISTENSNSSFTQWIPLLQVLNPVEFHIQGSNPAGPPSILVVQPAQLAFLQRWTRLVTFTGSGSLGVPVVGTREGDLAFAECLRRRWVGNELKSGVVSELGNGNKPLFRPVPTQEIHNALSIAHLGSVRIHVLARCTASWEGAAGTRLAPLAGAVRNAGPTPRAKKILAGRK